MRKRILALLLAAATALGLCACAPEGDRADSGKLSVVCSLFPYYDFVRVIGGEWVEPRLLVAAGREAHSFEPTPADVIRVSRADVFVYNGGEGEQWVDEILSSAGENIPTVLRMMDYAQTLEEEPVDGDSHDDHDDHDGHDGHDHDSDEIEYDEHIWTSPVEAEKLCRAICDALCAADPAHAADFRANLAEYLTELSELDADFRQVCREKKRDLLVFGDRFPLLYFCREYGLRYRAAFHGCSSDTEPSLYTLKFLIDKVREEQIPVVYALELSSQRVAESIAETTGARVVTFYSCQTVSQADWAAGEGCAEMWRRCERGYAEWIRKFYWPAGMPAWAMRARPFGSIWIFRCAGGTTSASWVKTAPASPRCSKACWACCPPCRAALSGAGRSGAEPSAICPSRPGPKRTFPPR